MQSANERALMRKEHIMGGGQATADEVESVRRRHVNTTGAARCSQSRGRHVVDAL